jgi:tetratricopeptide (TPR) repeat protein
LVFDNNEIILQDTRIHSATTEHIRQILDGPYWEIKLINLYRPLTTLSYLLNYSILGNAANPLPYHWINFLLHAINTALVYILGVILFQEIGQALLLAILWTVHPVLTESVTNIVGRADLLAAFGVLAGLLCYHRFLHTSARARAAWLFAVSLATTVGIFSKESAIVLIAVLLLYDFTVDRGVLLRSRLLGYAAVVVPCLAYFAARAAALRHLPYTPVPFTDNPLVATGLWAGRATAVKIIGKYPGLLAWPSSLSADYSFNAIPVGVDFGAIFALAVCLAVVALAAHQYRRNTAVFFGVGFFFVALAPTSNVALLIGTIMAERFLYLPSLGFLICAVCAVAGVRRRLSTRNRTLLTAAAALLILAVAARTYDRNRDWLDEQRLWSSAVEAAPGSYKAHLLAAYTAQRLNALDWTQAIRDMDSALTILAPLPDSLSVWSAYSDAGAFYRLVGDRAKAGQLRAAGIPAAAPDFWYRKALDALLRSEAILKLRDQQYRHAYGKSDDSNLTLFPARIYLEMGRTYLALADPAHARSAFERGRTLESDPDILEQLGGLYEQSGDTRRAVQALVEALYIDPNRGYLRPRLVDLYSRVDPAGCSVVQTNGARDLNPDCLVVHSDICHAAHNVVSHYLQRGLEEEAAKSRRIATQDLSCQGSDLR